MAGALLFTVLAVLVAESSGFMYFGCVFIKCKQRCAPGFWKSECYCEEGFILNKDELSCDALGPCDADNECEHNCYVFPVGPRCSCYEGYTVNSDDLNKCDAITPCTSNRDIVFLIDSCKELGDGKYRALVYFIARLSQHNLVGNTQARFGAYNFGNTTEKIFDLGYHDNNYDVSAMLKNSPHLGGTGSTNSALEAIHHLDVFSTASGGRSNAPDILVVFLDGLSTDVERTRALISQLVADGIRIIAVGFGSEVTQEGVDNVASSKDDAFVVSDVDSLDEIEEILAESLC